MPPNDFRSLATRQVLRSVAIVAVLSCNPKDGELFGLPDAYDEEFPDVTAPELRAYINQLNSPINDDRFAVVVREVPGAPRERVTGLHLPSIKATGVNGAHLSVSPSSRADVFEVDVTQRPQGANTLSMEAADVAGNKSAGLFTFILARTPPTVSHNIPAIFLSTEPNATLNVSGQISTPHSLTASTMYVRQPLANGECSSTAPLVAPGTTAGTVNQNTFPIPTGGQFTFPVMFNGPSTAQLPQTFGFCFQFAAADNAVNRFGEPNPNRMDQLHRLAFTWDVMAPSTGTISGRVTVNMTSPLPGVTVAIPGRSTTTDVNGNYSLGDVPVGATPVTISNVPADVYCPVLSQTRTVTASQPVVADFNCLRLLVGNYTTTAQASVRNDPSGHEPFLRVTNITTATVRILPNNGIEVVYGIPMTGTITRLPDGTFAFTANGSGTISGRSATGTFTSGVIEVGPDGRITKVTGIFTFGTQGQLPGGQPVSYDVMLTSPVLIP